MKKLMIFAVIALTIAVVFLCGCPAEAEEWQHDPWTTQDTVLQGTFLGLLFIDSLQTWDFLYKDNRIDENSNYSEMNPILGKHPSKQKLITYCIGTAIGHTAVSYISPKFIRTIWQSCWIGIEGSTVYRTHRMGIRVGFNGKF